MIFEWGGKHEDEEDSVELLINGVFAGFAKKDKWYGGYMFCLDVEDEVDSDYDTLEGAKSVLLERAKEWVEHTLFYLKEYKLV